MHRDILAHILDDINAKEYYYAVKQAADTIEMVGRVKSDTRRAIVLYLHLQQEGYPILLDDIMKYVDISRTRVLSIMNRNTHTLPYSRVCTIEYVKSVYRRIETELLQSGIGVASNIAEIEAMHAHNYFCSTSLVYTCICLCLHGHSARKIAEIGAKVFSTCTITHKRVQSELQRMYKKEGNKKRAEIDAKRTTKWNKAKKIVEMYKKENIKKIYTSNEHASSEDANEEYETVLMENMAKQGATEQAIYDMTKKGMQYYMR